jgi:hypothetical protein
VDTKEGISSAIILVIHETSFAAPLQPTRKDTKDSTLFKSPLRLKAGSYASLDAILALLVCDTECYNGHSPFLR